MELKDMNIDVTKIKKFVIFKKDLPEELRTDSLKSKKDIMYIFRENEEPLRIYCDDKNMNDVNALLKEYLVEKITEIGGEETIDKYSNEELVNMFLQIENSEDLITREEIDNEYFNEMSKYGKEVTSIATQEEDQEKKKSISGKKIAAGVLATTAIAGGLAVGLSQCAKKDEDTKTNVDYDTADFKTIMDSLPKDSNQRKFFESVFEETTKINGICGQGEGAIVKDKTGKPKKVKTDDGKEVNQYYFSLAEDTYTDKDGEHLATLSFSPSEIIAAKLLLNNYTPEQIAEIVGNTQLNVEKLESDFSSFTHKMFVYSMNGKAVTGIGELIDNPEVKETFEQIEQRIVNFNLEPSQNKADKLIRDFAEFFTDGGKTGNKEYSTTAYVLANMVDGYRIANSNRNEYLTVASKVEEESYSGSGIQKGASLKFYLDAATGVCKDAVTERIATNSEALKNARTVLLTNLAEGLVDAGKSDLANEVMSNNYIITDKLEDKIMHLDNDEITNALESYNNFLVGPNHDQITVALNKEFKEDVLTDEEDEELVNNRIYVEKTLQNSSDGITREQWDKMTDVDKLEYAKEHGEKKVVTSTATEEIKDGDYVSAEDQEKIIKGVEDIKKGNGEVSLDDQTKTDMQTYRGLGYIAAGAYSDEEGAYKYSGTIENKTNPDYTDIVYANGRWQGNMAEAGNPNNLDSIAAMAYAFNGETITSSDSQIQARFAKDVSEFVSVYGNDSYKVEAYKDGWLYGIEEELASAIEHGKVTKEEAIRLYKGVLSKSTVETKEDNNVVVESPKQEAEDTTPVVETQPKNDNPDSHEDTDEEKDKMIDDDVSDLNFIDQSIGISNSEQSVGGSYATSTDAPDAVGGFKVYTR